MESLHQSTVAPDQASVVEVVLWKLFEMLTPVSLNIGPWSTSNNYGRATLGV
jgi:hypothetical protein